MKKISMSNIAGKSIFKYSVSISLVKPNSGYPIDIVIILITTDLRFKMSPIIATA